MGWCRGPLAVFSAPDVAPETSVPLASDRGRSPALPLLCVCDSAGAADCERGWCRALSVRLGRRGGGLGRSRSRTFERRLLAKLNSANGLRGLQGCTSSITATEQEVVGRDSSRPSLPSLERVVSANWTRRGRYMEQDGGQQLQPLARLLLSSPR